VVSAVGLAAGLGFWSGAVVGTVITVVVLVAERPTRRLVSSLRRAREQDGVSPNHDRRDARSAG
jgi:uncharacterized membrane protein YhiD involved in acid resistance